MMVRFASPTLRRAMLELLVNYFLYFVAPVLFLVLHFLLGSFAKVQREWWMSLFPYPHHLIVNTPHIPRANPGLLGNAHFRSSQLI